MIKSYTKLLKLNKDKRSVPKSFQDTIPISTIYEDGIFKCGNKYTKTYRFSDINFSIASSEDTTSPVAIGFRAKKSNGKYKYFWLYRVKFGIPASSLATKGDSITFSTPTIEGTIMRRNKPDGKNNHPWKAEVTEGDTGVETSVITNWYSKVYEPTYIGE